MRLHTVTPEEAGAATRSTRKRIVPRQKL